MLPSSRGRACCASRTEGKIFDEWKELRSREQNAGNASHRHSDQHAQAQCTRCFHYQLTHQKRDQQQAGVVRHLKVWGEQHQAEYQSPTREENGTRRAGCFKNCDECPRQKSQDVNLSVVPGKQETHERSTDAVCRGSHARCTPGQSQSPQKHHQSDRRQPEMDDDAESYSQGRRQDGAKRDRNGVRLIAVHRAEKRQAPEDVRIPSRNLAPPTDHFGGEMPGDVTILPIAHRIGKHSASEQWSEQYGEECCPPRRKKNRRMRQVAPKAAHRGVPMTVVNFVFPAASLSRIARQPSAMRRRYVTAVMTPYTAIDSTGFRAE